MEAPVRLARGPIAVVLPMAFVFGVVTLGAVFLRLVVAGAFVLMIGGGVVLALGAALAERARHALGARSRP